METGLTAADLAEGIKQVVEALQEKINDLTAKLVEIEYQGVINATPYYKDGKYLQLIHPMTNGERVREYVGADPEKVQEALAAVERYKAWVELDQERAKYQGILNQIHSELSAVQRSIRSAAQRDLPLADIFKIGDILNCTRSNECHQLITRF